MNEIQKHCFDILVEFDAFCNQNDLQYCLSWGTLLGAVRHRGFIPWDDDIDLHMEERDFTKLKKLAKQGALPPHLRFEDPDNGYKSGIPKLRDLRYTNIRDNNGDIGYFIDICPIRTYSENQRRICRWIFSLHCIRESRRSVHNRFARSIIAFTCLPLHVFSIFLYWLVERTFAKSKDSDDWVDENPSFRPGNWFRRSDFFPYSIAEFEGKRFPVPHNADAILKNAYGQYMVPTQEDFVHFHQTDK